ncbi:hypothetical protein ILUMI_23614 [Ignelater luminosus]|uniref:HTH psq-type domain-containing protein n=1 Tax=Ignelater luminosus TaxID=2038154 RepID=A0A8K0CAL6_IGNLU|nr:hypothetical protein ILUMI_23614 [Ignelater luminosus]
MSTEYKRQDSNRKSYTEENPRLAIEVVKNGSSLYGASKNYGIPRKTLERKMKNNVSTTGKMGPDSIRHPDLSIQKAEGVSLAPGKGLNRVDVENYLKLLQATLEENKLFGKPGSIHNVNKAGLQFKNRPGHVVVERGPVVIVKKLKTEWTDSMLPGSDIVMSQKSAHVTATIFLNWSTNHFLPRKDEEKTLLILGEDSSRCSLKTFYYQSCTEWMQSHPGRKLERLRFGELTKSWGKSATTGNAMSDFKATGIFPWNLDCIPDHAYTVSDQIINTPTTEDQRTLTQETNIEHTNSQAKNAEGTQEVNAQTIHSQIITNALMGEIPFCSHACTTPVEEPLANENASEVNSSEKDCGSAINTLPDSILREDADENTDKALFDKEDDIPLYQIQKRLKRSVIH